MSASERLSVDLVTGFLGSGKTTVINAVLRDPAFAGAMVIVNEFGEVGLDHLLMSSADDKVVLLDSGCLCCAISGTLRDTLIDLLASRASGRVPAFDRVIVETSGLANPSPMVASLIGDSALAPRCALAQVLTLVDAANGAATLKRYVEAQRQVALADRLLITKLDPGSVECVRELKAMLYEINGHATTETWQRGSPAAPHFAPRLESPFESAPHGPAVQAQADALADAGAFVRGPLRAQYAAEPAHGESFGHISTHTIAFPGAVSWPTYAAWTHALIARFGRRLLRCKGLLALGDSGAPWVVQGVQGYFAPPDRLAAWPASSEGFLVFIGESISRSELDAIVETTAEPH